MSDEGKTDLEIALEQLGTISGDLAGVPVDHSASVVDRVRQLIQQYFTQVSAADAFRTALGSALNAPHSDGDAELIAQARTQLEFVKWCRDREGQMRLRLALAFLNSPFSFERLDLDHLTGEQRQRRRALLALKDLRTAVDGVNQEFAELVDEDELPVARQSCQDITYGMDVLLALLSAQNGREALLALIPDIAEGGELTSELVRGDLTQNTATMVLRGPWTPLSVEQYMRQAVENMRDSGLALSVSVNPPS
jgi:hypothetical protein